MSDRVAPSRCRSGAFLAIGVLLPFVARCGATPVNAALASRLDASVFNERFTVGRLVGPTAWHPCRPSHGRNDSVPCSAPVRTRKEFDRLASASQSAQRRLETDSSSGALRDAGLLALRLRDSTSNGLTNAVRLLDRARRSSPSDPTTLNDFAVAQLEMGERDHEHDARPYLTALEAIQRSLIAEPSLLPALFNKALILERLNLVATAQRAWARYLTVETDSAWRREARSHKSRLAHIANAHPLLQSGRDRAFWLLGEWGRAVGGGDEVRATAMLDSARSLAAALDTISADRTVQLSVATVDSAVRLGDGQNIDRRSLERLAAAHDALSDGFAARSRSYENAIRLFGRADRELRRFGSAAAPWAAFYQALAEADSGQFATADSLFQQVFDRASPQQQPALRGKVVSTRGVIEGRRGNFEAATRFYRNAVPYLEQAKEQENLGGIAYLLSESLSFAGQHAQGRAEIYRGLALLAPYRNSNFLNNQLLTVAAYARVDSLPYAALAVMDEVLSVATEVRNPDPLALDYRTQARDLISVGLRDSARAVLAMGMRVTEQLNGGIQARRRADLRLVEGQLLRTTDPGAALPVLDSVVRVYRSFNVLSQAAAALYETAMAARAAGDTSRARGLLRDAIAQIERQQTTVESLEGRAALFETADNAFDAMIDLEIRAGNAEAAFAYFERERAPAKLASIGGRSNASTRETPSLTSVGRRLASDMLLVEYAVLRDRTIVWTASRRGISADTIKVPRDTIAALVERFSREAAIPVPREGDSRTRLFDLLLGPVAPKFQGVQQLAIVCDRELSRLPFAALWDKVARQYVVERFRIRTEPSAQFLQEAQASASVAAGRNKALVVGNSVPDSALGLPPLPGAKHEAQSVAALYPGAVLLTDGEARRDAVVRLLQKSPRVFHFAGHAVFNSDRPELSYLALGTPRDTDNKGAGKLEAKEIAHLRLSNLDLVVLSACQTLSSRPTRTGAVAGLASSFLRAGAPAIVSTLWDVSDDMTGPLLSTFHRFFAAGTPADDALRLAQLEALKGSPRQRSAPVAWAAFIYTGP